MTQCEKIINYMKLHGSITTMDAFMDLGVTRLASRIHDLRSEGHMIEAETVKGMNRFGDPVHFMKYSLKEG